jgi:hypothetical protein
MQKYTSKNTSVNTTRAPAVYNKVRWDKLPEGVRVLDWGCGKDTTLTSSLLAKHGLIQVGYDPNWKSEEDNKQAEALLGEAEVFVCSNVLNVIDDDNIVKDICNKAFQHKYFFITVYEGDKSGIGKCSKENCYQRNAKVKSYLQYFSDDAIHGGVYIKNGVLTNALNLIK